MGVAEGGRTFDLAGASVLLFAPGNKPHRFDKACGAGPDAVVLDLEDAVAAADKDSVRRDVADYLHAAPRITTLMVRINPVDTLPGLADLAAAAGGALLADGFVVAKVESARDIEIVRAHLPPEAVIVATIESARGLAAAPLIAAGLAPGGALALGGADLAADLGCSLAWEPLLLARAVLVQAAATHRRPLIDVPYLDTTDQQGVCDETIRARSLGFTAKFAIHPRQVAIIRAAFTPAQAEVAHAERVVAALDAARGGVTQLDGRMIDTPVALAARQTLARVAASERQAATTASSVPSIERAAR